MSDLWIPISAYSDSRVEDYLCEGLTHWKRLWCWEGLGAGGEGDDRGWDGWMASLTRWTWVSVNSGSSWWTGRPGVLRFMGSQRVGHDWATDLIWSDPKNKSQMFSLNFFILLLFLNYRKLTTFQNRLFPISKWEPSFPSRFFMKCEITQCLRT